MNKTGSEEFGYMYNGPYDIDLADEYWLTAINYNHPMSEWQETFNNDGTLRCNTSECTKCGAVIYLFEPYELTEIQKEFGCTSQDPNKQLSLYADLLEPCKGIYIGEEVAMMRISPGPFMEE